MALHSEAELFQEIENSMTRCEPEELGGFENMEVARSHYCMAIKLNPNNMRALYGLFLCATNIAMSPKTTSTKKKEANKLAAHAMKQVTERYQEKCSKDNQVAALEGLVSSLQITSSAS